MATKRSSKKFKLLKTKSKSYIGKNQMPLSLLSELNRVMELRSERKVQERLRELF